MDRNSPKRLKEKKLNGSIEYKELEKLVEEDDEIHNHRQEIEKIKKDQQK